ncbi:bestrophin-like domain [Polynucleobacter sp.]
MFCIQGLFNISYLANSPELVFAISAVALSGSVWFGNAVLSKYRTKDTETSTDLGIIQTATLTLLGLIIGFTFSMAIARYDLRQTYEEAEANAIGTEFLRADLLPSKTAETIKGLLNEYLDQRILFYSKQDHETARQITQRTIALENAMWNELLPAARTQSTPTTALVISGMNDVINSQGYTQAAWWNRIPTAAWWLMGAIAIGANMLVGFGARNFKRNVGLFMIFPMMIAISFFLIADIDSPRGGVIRIDPRNLIDLKHNISTVHTSTLTMGGKK